MSLRMINFTFPHKSIRKKRKGGNCNLYFWTFDLIYIIKEKVILRLQTILSFNT